MRVIGVNMLLVDVHEMQLLTALIPDWPFQEFTFQVKDKLKLALLREVCLRHCGFNLCTQQPLMVT